MSEKKFHGFPRKVDGYERFDEADQEITKAAKKSPKSGPEWPNHQKRRNLAGNRSFLEFVKKLPVVTMLTRRIRKVENWWQKLQNRAQNGRNWLKKPRKAFLDLALKEEKT